MKSKAFFRRVRYILPISLFILLISSPIGAQTSYPMNVVTPSYIEASTPLLLTGDDASLQVVLPFSFTFYGVTYTEAYVTTNGYLNFPAGQSYFSYNRSIPRIDRPNGAIYAFWDDLYVDGMTSILTEVAGTAPKRKFVVEWRNVTFSANGIPDGGNRIDFEIVLYETGAILLQYRNIDDNSRERASSATIGVENATGDAAVQFSCNTAALGTGEFAILFGNVAKDVPVDINPRSCPNRLNLVSKCVLPVAILGTADFDVKTIDPTTVNLKGVAPLRWSLKDVATPYEPFAGKTDIYQCNTLGPDRNLDLMLMFDTEEVAAAIGDFDVVILELSGQLRDGTEIKGEDSAFIIRGHHKKEHEREHARKHKREHERKHKKEHKREHDREHDREKEK
jgi:hypothetical protein